MSNVICFGQQPNGIFPRCYFFAKVMKAKELQEQRGGEIVLFYHDSDHDYRETITILHDRQTGMIERLNFEQENKLQKKYSPLYLKRIPANWQEKMARRLPRFVDKELVELFASIKAENVADFCFQMYEGMGLLEGISIVRSSDPKIRQKAMDLEEAYFADVEYEGEIVRAQHLGGGLKLHRGGEEYIELPEQKIEKSQISPNARQRFAWMQSVVGCTHYVMGRGEKEYLRLFDIQDAELIERDRIKNDEEAWIQILKQD